MEHMLHHKSFQISQNDGVRTCCRLQWLDFWKRALDGLWLINQNSHLCAQTKIFGNRNKRLASMWEKHFRYYISYAKVCSIRTLPCKIRRWYVSEMFFPHGLDWACIFKLFFNVSWPNSSTHILEKRFETTRQSLVPISKNLRFGRIQWHCQTVENKSKVSWCKYHRVCIYGACQYRKGSLLYQLIIVRNYKTRLKYWTICSPQCKGD